MIHHQVHQHKFGPMSAWATAVTVTAILFSLMLLQGCVLPVTIVRPSDNAGSSTPAPSLSTPLTVTVGVAILGSESYSMYDYGVYEMLPISKITTAARLTDTAGVASLALGYTGTVGLEFALIHAGEGNKWELVYEPSALTVDYARVWSEYVVSGLDYSGTLSNTMPSMRFLRGQPYAIDSIRPLPANLPDATSNDLASLVDAMFSSTDPEYGAIARLLFTVEQDGDTRRVLYMSDQFPDGSFPPPTDEENSCSTNREGSIYCIISSWLGG